MVQVRREIVRFNHFCASAAGCQRGFKVAVSAHDLGVCNACLQHAHHGGVVEFVATFVVPHHLYRFECLLGAPPVVRHYRHKVGAGHHFLHPPAVQRRGRIKRHGRSAKHRTLRQCGIEHSWQSHIDTVNRASIGFARDVKALQGLADEGPLLGFFQGDVSRDFLQARRLCQFAVASAAFAGSVTDFA